jgi:FixJ family two-component response regulator
MAAGPAQASGGDFVLFLVDDESSTSAQVSQALAGSQTPLVGFSRVDEFLASFPSQHRGCLLVGSAAEAHSGLDLFQSLTARQIDLPVIQIVEAGDVPGAVRALKRGATDVVQKPLVGTALLQAVRGALEIAQRRAEQAVRHDELELRLARLTPRERAVLDGIVSGRANKQLARQLGISRRTADFHRANILRKMAVESVAELVKLVVTHRNRRAGGAAQNESACQKGSGRPPSAGR